MGKFNYDIEGSGSSSKDFNVYTGVSQTYKPNKKLSITPNVGVNTSVSGPHKSKTKSVGGSVTYSFTNNASLTAGGVKNLHSAKGPGYKGKGKDWNAGITFEYSWGGSKKK